MSHFLQNLINRHQTNGVQQKGHQIVQPRPRSRFEADSSAGEDITQRDSGTDTMTTTVNKQSSFKPNIAPHHQANVDTINPTTNHQADDANELFNSVIPPSEQRSISPETTNFINQNKSRQQNNDQTESTSKTERSFSQEKNNQELAPGDELNQRIQTILHRFNHQQPQRADQQSSSLPSQHSAFSNTTPVLDKNDPTGPNEFPIEPEQVFSLNQKNSGQKRNNENGAPQQETYHAGLLQAPEWLTKLQSDLNDRSREMNIQGKSEPMINVTIGRVEVRAVQTDSTRQSKPQNKPSGFMSLDDYLEQRNKGRS